MPNTTDRARLITELRAIRSKGDEKLDRRICEIFEIPWSSDEGGNFGGYNILPRRCRFTRSVEAAMSRIPLGWIIAELHEQEVNKDGQWIWGWRCSLSRIENPIRVCTAPDNPPSAALAIIITALEARETDNA